MGTDVRSSIMFGRSRAGLLAALGLLAPALGGCLRAGFDPNSVLGGAVVEPNTVVTPDPNGGGEPNIPPEPNAILPSGKIDQVYCSDFFAVKDLPISGDIGLFRVLAGDPRRISRNDTVTFDAAKGQLTDTTRGITLTVSTPGVVFGSAQVVIGGSLGGTFQLSDGTYWLVAVDDQLIAKGWRTADELIFIGPDTRHPIGLFNVTQCQAVSATKQ